MRRVVITGGTGLVGMHLSTLLEKEQYDVVHLSRSNKPGERFKTYRWEPESGYCDKNAFKNGDTVIHLAGANIGERRWTARRKRAIINSRTESARLIYDASVASGIRLDAFITASGKDYYGCGISEKIFGETDPPGTDFMAETCRLWEAAAEPFEAAGVRVVKIRTALVLAAKGSAISKLMAPARAGLIIRLGTGRQYFPWIHIYDLCNVYLKAVSDSAMSGPFNASAPDHITHDRLMSVIARYKHLPIFIPHVPGWLLHLILGEMSVVLTTGSRISPARLIRSGFEFRYPDIDRALRASYPRFDITSSLFMSMISIVRPYDLIMPSRLSSENVRITLAELMLIKSAISFLETGRSKIPEWYISFEK